MSTAVRSGNEPHWLFREEVIEGLYSRKWSSRMSNTVYSLVTCNTSCTFLRQIQQLQLSSRIAHSRVRAHQFAHSELSM